MIPRRCELVEARSSIPVATSRDNVVKDFTMNVGKSEPTSLIAKRQSLVINPEQMQDGRLEIVDADAVARDVESKFI